MFDWTNFLRGCKNCNNFKRDQFPLDQGLPVLLDPCRDDPLEYFVYDFDTGATAVRPEALYAARGTATRDLFRLDMEKLGERWPHRGVIGIDGKPLGAQALLQEFDNPWRAADHRERGRDAPCPQLAKGVEKLRPALSSPVDPDEKDPPGRIPVLADGSRRRHVGPGVDAHDGLRGAAVVVDQGLGTKVAHRKDCSGLAEQSALEAQPGRRRYQQRTGFRRVMPVGKSRIVGKDEVRRVRQAGIVEHGGLQATGISAARKPLPDPGCRELENVVGLGDGFTNPLGRGGQLQPLVGGEHVQICRPPSVGPADQVADLDIVDAVAMELTGQLPLQTLVDVREGAEPNERDVTVGGHRRARRVHGPSPLFEAERPAGDRTEDPGCRDGVALNQDNPCSAPSPAHYSGRGAGRTVANVNSTLTGT